MQTIWVILLFALGCAAFIFILSLIVSLIMVSVGPKMALKSIDRTAGEVKKMLPCSDCKQCGYDSCEQFAKACATSNRLMGNCVEGGPELNKKIKDFLNPPLRDSFGLKKMNAMMRTMNGDLVEDVKDEQDKEGSAEKEFSRPEYDHDRW